MRAVNQLNLRDDVRGEDAALVAKLTSAVGVFSGEECQVATELVEERLGRGARSGYEFLFAELDGTSAGYACYGRIAGTAASWDLYWIVVSPDLQGQGVGRKLIAAVEEAVSARGGKRIYVETSSTKRYRPTRRFYEYVGYVQAALLEDFYAPGDGKVIYVKKLRSAVG